MKPSYKRDENKHKALSFVILKAVINKRERTLCDPMDCRLPGSSVHGILQARILERPPFLSPRDLPTPGIEPRSPMLQADSLLSEPPGKPEG